MSQPDPETVVVVAIAEELTTQVRRIADALTTPVAVDLDGTRTTTDGEAQRTARRRDCVLNLLARLDSHWTLSSEERALLRQHVEAEIRGHDTARAVAAGNKRHVQMMYVDLREAQRERDEAQTRAEQANAVTAETKRLLERRTTTLRQHAERAEAALEGVREAAHLHRKQLFSNLELYTTIGPTTAPSSSERPAPGEQQDGGAL